MKRLTKRSNGGNVYVTAPYYACWGGRTVQERAFCVNCHGAKDNRGIDRTKCGPLAIIDRLAAYEDTGLMPEDVTDLMAAHGTAIEKLAEYRMREEKKAPLCYSDKQRHRSPPNTPLTLEELRKMDGEPVWLSWAGHPEAGWALVCVRSKQNDVIYLRGNQGVTDLVGFILRDGGKIYRRKPEEGMKWQP